MANIFEAAFTTLKNGMTVYYADSKARKLIEKLKALVDTKYGPDNPPPAGRIWYATCSTAAGTGAKVATSSTGDFALQTGAMVRLKCTTSNTAANPTLSIDGSTAKTIQPKSGTSGMAYRWRAQEVIDLVYDGSNFIMSLGPEADTSFYGITKLNSSTSSTSTTEAATPSAVKAAYDLADSKASVPVAISDGGTGATTVVDAQKNLHIYTTVGQLNLTSSATMADIATAMPTQSIAMLNTSNFDGTTGMTRPDGSDINFVIIFKNESWRTFALGARTYAGVNLANTKLYYASWDNQTSAFNGWRKIALSDAAALAIADGGTGATTAADAIAALKGFDLDKGTEIPANANLNNYTTPGVYYSPDATRSATLTNAPLTTSGFKLVVMQISSVTGQLRQMAYINGSVNIYTRLDNGGTWGAWRYIFTSAHTIPIATGGTGATSASAALTNLGAVRPNILENWYFVGGSQNQWGKFPINQRGQTAYTSAGYTIDRWTNTLATSTVNVKTDCVQFVSGNAASYKRLRQILPTNLVEGQTYTASMLYKANSKSGTAALRINYNKNNAITPVTYDISTGGVKLVSNTVTVPTGQAYDNAVELLVGNTSSDVLDIDIYAIKLELGSSQTLAHQENGAWVLNEVPKFEEEWEKCRSYYLRIDAAQYVMFGFALASNATTAYCILPSVPLRATGRSLAGTSGNLELYWPGEAHAVTAVSHFGSTQETEAITLTTTGLTAGRMYALRPNATGYINISAEL